MIKNYPSDTDVYSVVLEKMDYGNVRDFYKQRGILYISNKRQDIASQSCRLFLGENDYEEMRKNTIHKKNYKKISGIELNSSKNIPEITSILSDKKGLCLDENTNLYITDVIAAQNDTIRCKVEYTSKNIGTVDLLSEVKNTCEFQIEKKDDRKLVLTHHEKNEDYAKILEIFNIVSTDLEESGKITPREITLDIFSISQKIELFDRILTYKFKEFLSENVISIKIRKGENDEGEVPNNDLKGINEAIIRGDNLRTNEFVKKFESSGYYFYGVILKLAHKKDPIKITVEIFFKHKPPLPEISIKDSYEIIDDKEQKKLLPEHEQNKYLKDFWEILIKIYYDYLEEIKKKNAVRNEKKQVTLLDF